MKRNLPVFLVLSLVAAAAAQEPSPVDRVVAAHGAGDREALSELAAQDSPDPWILAEELCVRGERNAALAFARAAPRPDTRGLPAYVQSRSGRPGDDSARAAVAKAEATVRGGRHDDALNEGNSTLSSARL